MQRFSEVGVRHLADIFCRDCIYYTDSFALDPEYQGQRQGKDHRAQEMAEQLAISVKTIDLYRSRVMKRMQAETLAELVGMVIAAGLVDALDLRGAP